eukprot:CAMPEP_0179062486 /NCGR_PEP_ID=MMETSP0796-20121207/26953_1 /TAXON_ID=73915 /ORGANISM="Pyrodinium bahamense, Strain pbaha01" /LENGTH=53 /DNA_ID=CAMNT_0020759395 /DNA_START=22 /DNA_END=183 /DNA_ORIENTATION=+
MTSARASVSSLAKILRASNVALFLSEAKVATAFGVVLRLGRPRLAASFGHSAE